MQQSVFRPGFYTSFCGEGSSYDERMDAFGFFKQPACQALDSGHALHFVTPGLAPGSLFFFSRS